jgi:hypothetical protein
MVNDGTMNLAIGIWVVKTKGDNHAKTLWNEKEKKEKEKKQKNEKQILILGVIILMVGYGWRVKRR